MPKTKFQEIIFGLMMVTVMCYTMTTYNIVLSKGLTNQTFLMGLGGFCITGPIAFIIEYFWIGKWAKRLAFRLVNPRTDKPIFITLAISAMTVALMCPVMSLVGTLLFDWQGVGNIAINWIHGWVLSFPMALCWNIFYGGPLVRILFGKMFGLKNDKNVEKKLVKLAKDEAK